MADEARALLAEALNRPTTDLPAAPVLGDTPGWDSLSHIRLVLLLEERLNRRLDSDEVLRLTTVQTIDALLNEAPPAGAGPAVGEAGR